MATYDFDLTAICEKPKRGALPTPEAIPKMKAEKLAKCLKDYGRAHPNVANAVFLARRSSPRARTTSRRCATPTFPSRRSRR